MFKKNVFVFYCMIFVILPCCLSSQDVQGMASEKNESESLVSDETQEEDASLQGDDSDEDYSGYEEDDYEDEYGVQWDFGGKIESVHGISLYNNGDYIASRNFVTGFVGFSLGASYAKISASAE